MPIESRRLSFQDAAFLYYERDHLPLHIGSIALFESEIPYETFAASLNGRLHLIPRYRQRVFFPPMNVAHPTWEDDPEFDIRKHVFDVEAPAPGDDAALARLASEIFAPRLSRDKPLWEIHVVRGLEGGRGAMISKVHHCLVDGVAGIQLLMATLDLTPNPEPTPPPVRPFEPAPLPDPLSSWREGLWDRALEGWQQWTEFQMNLMNPRAAMDRMRDLTRALEKAGPYLLRPAPETCFSAKPGRQRDCAWSEFSFAELRSIRQALGGTVNDVVLAILSGGLGSYFATRGDPTDIDFRTMIPVNVRRENETDALGNRVSIMIAQLPLAERDPIERLRLIREQMTRLKDANQAGGLDLLMEMASNLPVPVQALLGQLDTPNTLFNVTCTNVPGPMIPLYSVGRKLLAHYPLVPLAPDLALAVGVTSYNHMLYFTLMADPERVSDLRLLKECLDESFLELRDAAGVPVTELPQVQTNGGARQAAEAIAS
jgi:WS/DGAT/MGAT family acyltransferase